MRSDESRAPGDEDLHFGRWRRRSAASRYTSRVAAAVAPHVNWPARLSPPSRKRSLAGPTASTMARAIDAGSLGSHKTAAPPAVSGKPLISEIYDRAAARHRLENGEAEGLVERRIHVRVSRLVEADGFLERNPADEDQISRDAELRREGVQLSDVLLVASVADDRQLAIPELTTGQRPRPQQSVTILVGPQRRHEQHERLRDAVRGDPRSSRADVSLA